MQQARRSERDFTRERALPLQRLVPLLLNFRKGTNRDELDQFFETITDDPASVTPVSEAAFCRARKKLKPEALVTLNNVLLDSANQQIAQQRWRGLRVLAVDGSTGRLPNLPAIEEYFGKPSGSGVPLARFSRLFYVLNDQILHADMVPYATGERELAAEYLLYSRPDDLFLYDRGYPAFWLFAFHAQEQSHYCARVRHDFHSEVKAFVADGAKERIVVLTPNTASARQCREGHLPADPLRVRLIRVELESGEVEVLITSLLDTKAYPYRAFAKLYALRWGIEENYKREKQRLEIENFSGRSPWVLLPASSARLSDQLRQCAVQDEEQPGQAFLGNFATGPLMAVIAAYGRCGSGRAHRTQVPERHEKSPSPRIPDAVSKNTVRLKLMTLNLVVGCLFHEGASIIMKTKRLCIVLLIMTLPIFSDITHASNQASLRSRERFWDIRVPKIDSTFDNSLVPRTSWSPGVPPQHRKLVAATHRSPI